MLKGLVEGLIKSPYCPYLWILFICLFVSCCLFFLQNGRTGDLVASVFISLIMADQEIQLPLFSLVLAFYAVFFNVCLCFHFLLVIVCYFIVYLLFILFLSSLPWEGGPQVDLIYWPEPHSSFLMPSWGLICIC